MRIISGKHKGRRITAPKKLPVRPTTDRAKEALFNILNHRLEWENISSLDLYAGTGNISYELASRGLSKLTAVDQNKHCAHFIYQTNEALDLSITIVKNSVEKFLANPSGSFDFIFADPPYDIKSFLYGKKGKHHSDFDHYLFYEHAQDCMGNVMITYNSNEVLRELYQDWFQTQWDLTYTMHSGKAYREDEGNRKELLVTNYAT